jgi:Spy/CpxP family protein refolding chaperone
LNPNETNETKHRKSRHGFWFGLVVGGLAGALTAGGVVATATVKASPLLAASALHRHGFGRGGGFLADPERARQRAEFATEWVFDRVEATDAQKDEAKRIVDRTIDGLLPIASAHRANRDVIHEELTRNEIDPEALERIRREQMELFDNASRELTRAITELAQVLEPEQRQRLAEMAEQFHH